MPTLVEAWLAEQTAERLPWRHPPMSEDRPTGDDHTECLNRWRVAVRALRATPRPIPAAHRRQTLDGRSGRI